MNPFTNMAMWSRMAKMVELFAPQPEAEEPVLALPDGHRLLPEPHKELQAD